MNLKHHLAIPLFCALAVGIATADAQETTRKETRSGILDFEANGYPTDASIERMSEHSWIQTNPKKGFFAYFCWYSPTKAFFDRSWKMGNIKEVK